MPTRRYLYAGMQMRGVRAAISNKKLTEIATKYEKFKRRTITMLQFTEIPPDMKMCED